MTVLNDPDGPLDYLTAVGTVGAAIVPLIFFLIERKGRKAAERARGAAEARRDNAEALQRQRENEYRDRELAQYQAAEEAAEERAVRAQAELVHVWAETSRTSSLLHLLNTSKMPVVSVMVSVIATWYPHVGDDKMDVGKPLPQDFLHIIKQLGPTGDTPIKLSLPETDWDQVWAAPDDHSYAGMEVERVAFTDVNGVRWHRYVMEGNRLERSVRATGKGHP